jgi:hypothetical protein
MFRGRRWLAFAALLPAALNLLLWGLGVAVHSSACPTWCLMCVNTCPVAGLDLSWLVALGVVGNYLLILTVPVSLLAFVVVWLLARRAVAT